jgi:hypothetical protein
MELQPWQHIKQDFSDTLIVGNGGSIALSPAFRYTDLYQNACKNKLVSEAAQQVFEQFSKANRDFERVLYSLWQADFVNQKLELAEDERKKVRKAYLEVRLALIKSVKEIHPDRTICTDERLSNIGRFMADFRTVFSLNYDLIVYWALLQANSNMAAQLRDGFSKISKRKYSSRIEKRLFDADFIQSSNNRTTKVFYPHGNLVLYQTSGGEESKLAANRDGLLNTITKYWRDNDGQPLFVCEGSAEAKVSTISQSKYLSSVFQQALPASRQSLTIYGWSIGEQDSHILKQLALSNCQIAAVSVFGDGKSEKQLAKEKDGMRDMLRTYAGINQVEFFDAQSAGCWANGVND